MSAHNSFAIFNAPSDFHLDLVARLVGVNLDCLEKMLSTQISPLKELLERTPSFSLGEPGQTGAWWSAVGLSSIEYWKACTLDSLELPAPSFADAGPTFGKVNLMMSSRPVFWQDSSGKLIACTEKIKVLNENLDELRQVAQDALEDGVLMGVLRTAIA
jgi:hypothetical protein